MTRLRQMMLEELQRRNFSRVTVKNYIDTVERFAKHFGRPPDQLGLDERELRIMRGLVRQIRWFAADGREVALAKRDRGEKLK